MVDMSSPKRAKIATSAVMEKEISKEQAFDLLLEVFDENNKSTILSEISQIYDAKWEDEQENHCSDFLTMIECLSVTAIKAILKLIFNSIDSWKNTVITYKDGVSTKELLSKSKVGLDSELLEEIDSFAVTKPNIKAVQRGISLVADNHLTLPLKKKLIMRLSDPAFQEYLEGEQKERNRSIIIMKMVSPSEKSKQIGSQMLSSRIVLDKFQPYIQTEDKDHAKLMNGIHKAWEKPGGPENLDDTWYQHLFTHDDQQVVLVGPLTMWMYRKLYKDLKKNQDAVTFMNFKTINDFSEFTNKIRSFKSLPKTDVLVFYNIDYILKCANADDWIQEIQEFCIGEWKCLFHSNTGLCMSELCFTENLHYLNGCCLRYIGSKYENSLETGGYFEEPINMFKFEPRQPFETAMHFQEIINHYKTQMYSVAFNTKSDQDALIGIISDLPALPTDMEIFELFSALTSGGTNDFFQSSIYCVEQERCFDVADSVNFVRLIDPSTFKRKKIKIILSILHNLLLLHKYDSVDEICGTPYCKYGIPNNFAYQTLIKFFQCLCRENKIENFYSRLTTTAYTNSLLWPSKLNFKKYLFFLKVYYESLEISDLKETAENNLTLFLTPVLISNIAQILFKFDTQTVTGRERPDLQCYDMDLKNMWIKEFKTDEAVNGENKGLKISVKCFNNRNYAEGFKRLKGNDTVKMSLCFSINRKKKKASFMAFFNKNDTEFAFSRCIEDLMYFTDLNPKKEKKNNK